MLHKNCYESYKNNCLVLQIATNNRYVQRQITSQTSSVLFHGQFVWRYLMTFRPALILSLLTHTPAAENAFTPATQNAINQVSWAQLLKPNTEN